MGHRGYPARGRAALSPLLCSTSVSRKATCARNVLPGQRQPAPQAGSPSPARGRGLHVSPVPVSTFTFCVFPSLTATCFSTLATSSQAAARP